MKCHKVRTNSLVVQALEWLAAGPTSAGSTENVWLEELVTGDS